ncbi:MAG: ABC transporter permease [Clostridiales bacterium]|nr:ABC transporter permease [Clostridiales bacterium]
MSIRAFFNSVKEGFRGIARHPLVTVASVTTILLMLTIMSAFFIFSTNARNIMRKLSQQPPIEIYMRLDTTPEELEFTESVIAADQRIINYIKRSPEENYIEFKNNLKDSSSVLDDFDYTNYLPYTFNIQISDPSMADEVVSTLQTLPGVNKVNKESNVMSFLTKARNGVNIATVVSFLVLFVIALFIISNMVRISVYSRAGEIEIMKFVGATNFYIRMPYIIEGAIVGLISALCAWVITTVAYRQIYYAVMANQDPGSFYALLPARSLMWLILIICAFMGIIIGSVGSGISVRKYIEV